MHFYYDLKHEMWSNFFLLVAELKFFDKLNLLVEKTSKRELKYVTPIIRINCKYLPNIHNTC